MPLHCCKFAIIIASIFSLICGGTSSSSTSSSIGGNRFFVTRQRRRRRVLFGGLLKQQQQQQQQQSFEDNFLLLRSEREEEEEASRIPRILLETRGGAVDDDESDDNEYDYESDDDDNLEEDDSEDDEDLFDIDENEMDEIGEDDFSENNYVGRFIEGWKETPPLTKLYLQASFAATGYAFLFNKNEFPTVFLLEWKAIATKLQIWRIFTSFLNFGSFGLGYLMTTHFVWTYMSTLERLNHSEPYNFWIMIVFAQLAMVIGYPLMKLSPQFLGHNLSTFLVYVWSRYHEGIEVNMFELFNTRAELLPWFFLAQTFLLEGDVPVLDFLGIVFGHVYHHLNCSGRLRAPASLKKWYHESSSKYVTAIREQYKTISSEFEL